jgi:hypothetical protein
MKDLTYWSRRAKALFIASVCHQIDDPFAQYVEIATLYDKEKDEDIRDKMQTCMMTLTGYGFDLALRERGWYAETENGHTVWYHVDTK